MKKTIINFIYWLPTIFYMGLIFYMSSYPPLEPVKTAPIYLNIKLVHIIEYGILNFLVYWSVNKTTSMPFFWNVIYSVMITVLYGLTDELHQVFVPGRSGQLIDIVANFIGCLFVQAFIFLRKFYLFRK